MPKETCTKTTFYGIWSKFKWFWALVHQTLLFVPKNNTETSDDSVIYSGKCSWMDPQPAPSSVICGMSCCGCRGLANLVNSYRVRSDLQSVETSSFATFARTFAPKRGETGLSLLGHLLWEGFENRKSFSKLCFIRAWTYFRPGVRPNEAPQNTYSLLGRGI